MGGTSLNAVGGIMMVNDGMEIRRQLLIEQQMHLGIVNVVRIFPSPDGEFVVGTEPGGWFSKDQYYKTYISGNLQGHKIKIGPIQYQQWVDYANERWGYFDNTGHFVPGYDTPRFGGPLGPAEG
jgi:hypothetical protein